MSIGSKSAALRQIRSAFAGGAVAGLADAQLLERFAGRPGEEASASAFAALVDRHGPMVRGTCRAMLRDERDAQDAFQAVFLTLAMKAKTLWVRDSLGPWLHSVSVRVAARMRVANARRLRHERRIAEGATFGEAAPMRDDGVIPLIHEEIDRLPGHYRAALVLCDLQGLTHEQAASHLGLPIGTIKSRQSRARERLRGRLIRRGIVPSAALAWWAGSASASIPVGWAEATLSASLAVGRGVPAAEGLALALGHGTLHSPAWAGVGRVALAVLALVGAASGFHRLLRGAPIPPPLASGPTSIPDQTGITPEEPLRPEDSRFAVRLAADAAHDAEAIRRALAAGGTDRPPDGYTWLPVSEDDPVEREGLILRDAAPSAGRSADLRPFKLVLVRDTPRGVDGRHLYEVADMGVREWMFLRFSDEGQARLSELADGRLREDGGTTASRLAVVVDGEVVAATPIRRGRRHALSIGPRIDMRPVLSQGRDLRLIGMANRNRATRPKPLPSKLPDPDPARRAYGEALHKLEWAQRAVITMTDSGESAVVDRSVLNHRDEGPAILDLATRVVTLVPPSLFVHESAGDRGRQVASLTFERDGAALGTLLVFENGEWTVRGQPDRLAVDAHLDLRRLFDDRRRSPRFAE